MTRPGRALMEAGTIAGTESALVSFNDALWHNVVTTEELWDLFESQCHRWPGSQSQQIVLRLMNDKSQTPAETRGFYMCWRHGIPMPLQQYDVYDGDELVGTTDFAWPQFRLFGECDGLRKYFRDKNPDEAPEDVIVREKRREDRIRQLTGWMFFRYIWADLYHPARTCAALRRMMYRAA